jgi:hypothetical protein
MPPRKPAGGGLMVRKKHGRFFYGSNRSHKKNRCNTGFAAVYSPSTLKSSLCG